MKHRLAPLLVLLGILSACSQDNPVPVASDSHGDSLEVEFTLSLENLSQSSALTTPVSPLVWTVTRSEGSLFAEGRQAGSALERLAEDGQPEALLGSLATALAKGSLNLAPGQKLSIRFKARPGSKLSFAGRIAQGNDLFVAPAGEHLDLFDSHKEPIDGDVPLALWDAGTEVNQAPGQGSAQGARQTAADTGSRESRGVMHLDEVKDGFSYPAAAQLLKVSLSNNHEHDHEAEAGQDHAD